MTDKYIFTTVYEQDSFVPVARIVERQAHLQEQAKINEDKQWQELENYYLGKKHKQRLEHQTQVGIRIYHYHNDHLGTPQELTNDRGDVVWLNYSLAWGGSFDKLNNVDNLDGLDVSADELQPIRFQGQSLDVETGLHYNRFRYYDSDVGMFVSRDPIQLQGNTNTFAYALNPITWIDPFGLAKTDITKATHVTYLGDKGGKPYIGYASMAGCKTAIEVIRERYKGGKLANEGLSAMPKPLYVGYGKEGKYTARGLEQKYYEYYEGAVNTKKNRLVPNKTSNRENPVGSGHSLRKEYLHSAGRHLKENVTCMCSTIPNNTKPKDCK